MNNKTKQSPKHSPLPWTVAIPCSSELTCRNIKGPDGEHVAKVGWMDFSAGDADLANAELIVRAVNNHEELVAVLYRALPFVEDHEGSEVYKKGVVAKFAKEIRELLAKLEAE